MNQSFYKSFKSKFNDGIYKNHTRQKFFLKIAVRPRIKRRKLWTLTQKKWNHWLWLIMRNSQWKFQQMRVFNFINIQYKNAEQCNCNKFNNKFHQFEWWQQNTFCYTWTIENCCTIKAKNNEFWKFNKCNK